MADKKISQLPLGNFTLDSIFPFVENGVTSQNTFENVFNKINSNIIDVYITGITYDNSNGTTTFSNTSGGTFQLTGFSTGYTYIPEDVINKQNNMSIDGSGILYPTVNAVNTQQNNLAISSINTGFIDVSDIFIMSRPDDFTLRLNPSDKGIIFKSQLLANPNMVSESILQIPLTDIPLSSIGLTGDGIYIKFIGYTDSGTTVYSDTTFEVLNNVCQLGILLLKVTGGTTSFEDAIRGVVNKPDISAYSNLEVNVLGIQSNVVIKPNNGLTVNNNAGTIKGMSVNWHGTNNDSKSINSSVTTSFTHLSFANTLTITPPSFGTIVTTNQYWSASANSLVNLSTASAATVQRWLATINGTIALQYGEREYTNLEEAKNNVSIASFLNVLPIGTYTEIGRMASISGTTNLSDINQCVFYVKNNGTISVSKFTDWGYITGNINDQTDLASVLATKDPCPPVAFLDLGDINTSTFNIPLNQGRNIKCSPKVNTTLTFIPQPNSEGKKNRLIFNMKPNTSSIITYPLNSIITNDIYRNVNFTAMTLDSSFSYDLNTAPVLNLLEYSGGFFQVVNGGIYKRQSDGPLAANSCSTSVSSGTGLLGGTLQPDGKVIIFGNFVRINGSAGLNSYTARLDTNGCRDATYVPSFTGIVNTVVVQPDGKIIAGGSFTVYSGQSSSFIARINTNLYKDTTFNVGSGFNGQPTYLKLQSDGKVLVYGSFTLYNGSSASNFIRLNTDGSRDNSFAPIPPNGAINSIAIQSDGKMLIGGAFTQYNSQTVNYLVRINTNGSIDNTFNTGVGFNNTVNIINIQSDGKILVGGAFTTYQGATANRLVRINTDGSFDPTFYVGSAGFPNTVTGIIIQPENRLTIGGNFTSFINPNISYVTKVINLQEKNYVLNIIQNNNNQFIIS